MSITCQWFAGCRNSSDGTVRHPVLGDVPTCIRCAEKLGLDLSIYPKEGFTLITQHRLRSGEQAVRIVQVATHLGLDPAMVIEINQYLNGDIDSIVLPGDTSSTKESDG